MGKIAKYVAIFAGIGFLLILIIRFWIGRPDATLYKTFVLETEGNYLNKLLAVLPKEYTERYSSQVLEKHGNVELVNYTDQRNPTSKNFIVLRDINTSNESFLKAHPFELVGTREQITSQDYNSHVSYLINLSTFNKYISEAVLTNKDTIVRKYCMLLSNLKEPGSYKILRDAQDVNDVITSFPLDHENTIKGLGYNIIDSQKMRFDTSSNVVYCWFLNKGIVKLDFTFSGTKIIDVSSEMLGYLGNEFPTCC